MSLNSHIIEIRKFIPSTICKKIILYFENSNDLTDANIVDPVNPINKDIRNCKQKLISGNTNSFGETLVLNYIKFKIKEYYVIYI